MKSIKKIILGLAVFAAALGFVACKQETEPQKDLVTTKPDDSQTSAPSNDSQTSAIVVFKDNLNTITFSSGKFTIKNSYGEAWAGTYIGNPEKDGTVELTVTKSLGQPLPSSHYQKHSINIENGEFSCSGLAIFNASRQE